MAMETLSSTQLLNFIMCTTTSTPTNNHLHFLQNPQLLNEAAMSPPPPPRESPERQGRRKRRRRGRASKNKEEAENQRMTHIAVERNRRKQMNDHLAILRSLMPPSYVHRGDQASIVGGAIEFVKELEHLLQSLESQKFLKLEQNATTDSATDAAAGFIPSPFFANPQYVCSPISSKYTSKSSADIADIEVTLIETHASIRILSRRRLRQLSKLVAGFHNFYLTILHLNLNTLDPLVFYSISAKVEEGCQLRSADEIASAVHHVLRILEEEEEEVPCVDSIALPSHYTP